MYCHKSIAHSYTGATVSVSSDLSESSLNELAWLGTDHCHWLKIKSRFLCISLALTNNIVMRNNWNSNFYQNPNVLFHMFTVDIVVTTPPPSLSHTTGWAKCQEKICKHVDCGAYLVDSTAVSAIISLWFSTFTTLSLAFTDSTTLDFKFEPSYYCFVNKKQWKTVKIWRETFYDMVSTCNKKESRETSELSAVNELLHSHWSGGGKMKIKSVFYR